MARKISRFFQKDGLNLSIISNNDHTPSNYDIIPVLTPPSRSVSSLLLLLHRLIGPTNGSRSYLSFNPNRQKRTHTLSLSLPSLQKLHIVISEVPNLPTYRPVPTYVYVYLPT